MPICYRGPAELDEPRLVRVNGEPEVCEPCLEIGKEPLCLVPMLESDDRVIPIAHDNNVARGTSLPPLVDP